MRPSNINDQVLNLESLPQDQANEIFKKLSIDQVIKLRLLSKKLRKAIDEYLSNQLTLNTLLNTLTPDKFATIALHISSIYGKNANEKIKFALEHNVDKTLELLSNLKPVQGYLFIKEFNNLFLDEINSHFQNQMRLKQDIQLKYQQDIKDFQEKQKDYEIKFEKYKELKKAHDEEIRQYIEQCKINVKNNEPLPTPPDSMLMAEPNPPSEVVEKSFEIDINNQFLKKFSCCISSIDNLQLIEDFKEKYPVPLIHHLIKFCSANTKKNEPGVWHVLKSLTFRFRELESFFIRLQNDKFINFNGYNSFVNQSLILKEPTFGQLKAPRLSNIKFVGMNFEGTIFSNSKNENTKAVFDDVSFSYCNLSKAVLNGANLQKSYFTHTNMKECQAQQANLTSAILSYTDLSNADLRGSCMANCDMSNSNLNCTNLEGADLSGACLIGANIKGANFTGAILRNSIFLPDSAYQNATVMIEYLQTLLLQIRSQQNEPQNQQSTMNVEIAIANNVARELSKIAEIDLSLAQQLFKAIEDRNLFAISNDYTIDNANTVSKVILRCKTELFENIISKPKLKNAITSPSIDIIEKEKSIRDSLEKRIFTHMHELQLKLNKEPNNEILIKLLEFYNNLKHSIKDYPAPAIDQLEMSIKAYDKIDKSFFKVDKKFLTDLLKEAKAPILKLKK